MRRQTPASLAHVSLLILAVSGTVFGCGKTVVEIDRQPNLMIPCRDAGTCECESRTDCMDPALPICVDGMCAPEFVYIDGGSGTDPDAAVGDGCGFRDPEPEQCNARDDDCDTRVDEDFKGADGLFSTPQNCGQCGLRCANLLPNLLTDGNGQVVPGATTCRNDGGGVFTCEPVLCATGFAPFFDASGHAVVCLPRVAAECQPCAQPADCGSGSGHACEPLGGEGSFCLAFCDARSGDASCTAAGGTQDCCPDGTTCTAQGGGHVCVPNSNSCRCTPDNLGLQRVCSRTGDAGATTCLGVETCTNMGGTAGWSSCDTGFVTDICDERDNDCNGTADDNFTVGGAYTLDTACGGCGNDCTTRWNLATHHATGSCNTSGPSCAFACVPDAAGGGTSCSSNLDCAGDMTGSTCDLRRRQCATACTTDAQCPSVCRGGFCTTACTTDAECQTTFGRSATCVANACVTQTNWTDTDGLELNGCECPATANGEDTPELPGSYPTSSFATVDRDCDGIDGDTERALFVRAGGTGTGTLAAPFGSIQAAITAFNPSVHRHILVATGTYVERVTLVAGVQVYGGYSVDFRSHDIALHRTIITAPPPDFSAPSPDHGVVRASDISTPTLFAGFTIEGYDVATAGRSSYAVLLERCTSALRFTHNTVLAGRGGDGASGAAGAPGARGGDGGNGAAASLCTSSTCTGNSQAGGVRGTNASCGAAAGCAGMESDGTESPQVASAPVAGCTYAQGGLQGTYNGSSAAYCRYDFNPPGGARNGTSGALGATGGNGTRGDGCSTAGGSFVAGRFVPATGSMGTTGAPGTGGQGGTAGGGVRNNKAATCTIPSLGNNQGDLGGSGGGGGAGGCGGAPGLPGSGGGASVAIVVTPTAGGQTPTLRDNLVTRAMGGAGGAGGPGGAGGLGGNPGRGGLAAWPSWAAGQGGDGGSGGAGGDGGGGGGACGGVSYGIVGTGIPAASLSANNLFGVPNGTPTGGAGGLGGYASGSASGQNGQNGESGNVRSY